jgi:phosphogluconate dehydratase
VLTIAGPDGLRHYTQLPTLQDGQLAWVDAPLVSGDTSVLTTTSAPFSADGGLKVLQGNLGRAVIKVSSVKPDHRVVQAPAAVFDSQDALIAAYKRGELNRDFVAVVRFQGPRANGMPELHSLTPTLANLQDKGFKVALITDGRMSGASGKVPAAIHITPEVSAGGPLGKVRDGDLILLDAHTGTLQALVPEAQWAERTVATTDLSANTVGTGRDLFGAMRHMVSGAEQGAVSFGWGTP